MSRRKVLFLAGLAAMVLLAVFGCSLLVRDDSAEPAGSGWYIKLRIQVPPAAKGITVSEVGVTGLQIRVLDPLDLELLTIDWAVGQGGKDYVVPVAQPGEHEIEVTHYGLQEGQPVQVTESATFTIRAMKITVIDIVPGCIGAIRVEGAEADAWLHGYWVQAGTMGPDTEVLDFRADGTFTMWGDYFASRVEDIETWGTWSLEGSTLIGNTVHFGEFTMEITKVSNDELVMPDTGSGPGGAWYRRGTEPGGWVFDQAPILLSEGAWKESGLEPLCMDLFKFVAPSAGTYAVEFLGSDSTDPYGNPYPYTMGFGMQGVYAADQLTKLSADWNWDVPEPKIVMLSAGDVAYIIVDASEGAGTYAIRIVSLP